jgi:ribonuclease PH
MPRSENRSPFDIRTVTFEAGVAPHAAGSVLISCGNTRVICAATIEESVPRWMKEQNVKGGWITAEYSMLPYSTLTRKPRDISKGRPDGRGTEIQRLIGRALRTSVDLDALGSRTLWVDCDVLQADGGTRTAAITGASVAIAMACRKLVENGKVKTSPFRQRVAAVSVGVVGGEVLVDLDYSEDRDAAVDMNLVMTEKLEFVELQGAGEEATFTTEQLFALVEAGRTGVTKLLELQAQALAL